jgi:Immunity protein 53
MSSHASALSTLARLQRWLAFCANGEWEHRYIIRIEILDNPGWVLSVDLSETVVQGHLFDAQRVDRTEDNWYTCRLEGDTFRGYGGVYNLEELIETFLNWAEPISEL